MTLKFKNLESFYNHLNYSRISNISRAMQNPQKWKRMFNYHKQKMHLTIPVFNFKNNKNNCNPFFLRFGNEKFGG